MPVSQSVIVKMNSYWAPEAPNQNQYTDRTLVDYDYYVTITCFTVTIRKQCT